MSGAESLPWWAAIPVALLLVLGGIVTLVGIARPGAPPQSFYQRIHGPAISIALGAGCILFAVDAVFHRDTVAPGDPRAADQRLRAG